MFLNLDLFSKKITACELAEHGVLAIFGPNYDLSAGMYILKKIYSSYLLKNFNINLSRDCGNNL